MFLHVPGRSSPVIWSDPYNPTALTQLKSSVTNSPSEFMFTPQRLFLMLKDLQTCYGMMSWNSKNHDCRSSTTDCHQIHRHNLQTIGNYLASVYGISSRDRQTNRMNEPRNRSLLTHLRYLLSEWLEWLDVDNGVQLQQQGSFSNKVFPILLRSWLSSICYDFNTLVPKQALTLSNITLSFLPLPTVTLSYLSIYFYSYIFLSFRPSPTSPYITLSLHFTLDHSASDNLSEDTLYR